MIHSILSAKLPPLLVNRSTAMIKAMGVMGIGASLSIGVAHAELIIHDSSSAPVKVVTNNASNAQLAHGQNSAINIQPSHNQATTNSVYGQTPTDASIIKLMQVMHIDEQIQSIIDGQKKAIDVINEQTNKVNNPNSQQDKQLSKRQQELQAQIQGILGQYAKVMAGGIEKATDKETMTQAYMQAAKAYYTQAEVDALIGFYDTPMGQSILAKQPQVTAAFLQQSLPKDMSETQQQLDELLPQVQQIIKGIF